MSRLFHRPSAAAQPDQKLTTEQAALYAGTTPERLAELRRNNKGPVYILSETGEPRYRPDALNSWIEYGRSNAA